MQKRYCEFRFNFVTPCLQLLFLHRVLEEQEPSDWWYTQISPWIHEPQINAQAHSSMVWGAAYRQEISYRSKAYSALQTNYIFYINISIAQPRDKNCHEGEGSRLNPPKVPHSWKKSKPWFITTLLVASQRLIHAALPRVTFPAHICWVPLPLPPCQVGTCPKGSCPTLCPSLCWH